MQWDLNRVLLIDDNEALLSVFTEFVELLRLEPFPILATKSVSLSAVKSMITQERCARVITDLNMCGLFDGFDVLDAALNLGLQPEHLVLCSTDIDGAVAKRVAFLGCFFLNKPVQLQDFQRVIKSPFSQEV